MTNFPIEGLVAKIFAAKEAADFQTANILFAIALDQMVHDEQNANLLVALGDYEHPFEEPELDEDGTFEPDPYMWLDGYYDVVFIEVGNNKSLCGIPAPLLSDAGRAAVLDDPSTRCFHRGGVTYDGRHYQEDYEAFEVIEAEGFPDIRRAWASSKWVLDPKLANDLGVYLANGRMRNVV